MGLFALFRRRPHERAGFHLYGAAVAAARDPWLFRELSVPDTLDGRFDLINLHVALLVRRLRGDADPRGAALAQAVFDAMFADMDVNLREMGVGDLSVGKRVKRMWEAFHGRALAYEAALEAGEREGLAVVLARNVWRGLPPGMEEGGAPGLPARRLAALATVQAAHLDAQPFSAFLQGAATFLPPAEVPDAA